MTVSCAGKAVGADVTCRREGCRCIAAEASGANETLCAVAGIISSIAFHRRARRICANIRRRALDALGSICDV